MAAARPRPGRLAPEVKGTIARPNTKSRQKAESAANVTKTANDVVDVKGDADTPVFTPDGRPLARVTFAASELIPTGDFANVCLGPMVATVWIDPTDPDPLPQEQLENIARAGNQLADTLFRDVLGIQRNIVLENLQEQSDDDTSSK